MTASAPDILKKILARKVEEIEARSATVSLQALSRQAEQAPPVRPFLQKLKSDIGGGRSGIVAEIKRASPSKGIIRPDFDPAAIARSYEAAGASCLSVLTDVDFFQGHDRFLQAAREATGLPVLRKDFVVDAYQVYEARVLGADCVLLIVSALGDALLRELYVLAKELGMDVLVEVHDEAEMERALALEPDLVGVNNRNLRTFQVDIGTTLRLQRMAPPQALLVTESGILCADDVALMRSNGIHAFLVGESFMRAPDPGEKLQALFYP